MLPIFVIVDLLSIKGDKLHRFNADRPSHFEDASDIAGWTLRESIINHCPLRHDRLSNSL
jgi:hypothetical protein